MSSKSEVSKNKNKKDKAKPESQPQLSGAARTAANKRRRIEQAEAKRVADAAKDAAHGAKRLEHRAKTLELRKELEIALAYDQLNGFKAIEAVKSDAKSKYSERQEKTLKFMNTYYPEFMAAQGCKYTIDDLMRIQRAIMNTFKANLGTPNMPKDGKTLSDIYDWSQSDQNLNGLFKA